MANTEIKTLLAVDCGNVNTTAIFIEQDDTGYRLRATSYAPSTHVDPWREITLAIQEAIRGLEQQTGRTLLTPGGRPITPQNVNHQGVDAFLVVSSAGEPLPLALVGLIRDISLDSARRAATTTYTKLTTELSLDTEINQQAQTMESRLQALQQDPPEAILLVGGTEGGAKRPVIEMANLVSMAMHILPDGNKPPVLYAGNSELRPQVAEMLGSVVTAVDNIRPTMDMENLAAPQIELERLYIQRRLSRLPGMQTLQDWSPHSITPVSQSFQKVMTYLGKHQAHNVIGVDIGSGSTMVATESHEFHGLTIRSDAGVGHSLGSLLKLISIELFHRWLPFDIHPYDLYNRLLNKSLSPPTVPVSREDLLIEYAVAREALRLVVAQARKGWPLFTLLGDLDPQWNLLVGAGRTLAAVPHWGHAALMMLDGIEPWGVTSLALDRHGLTSMLGAIAVVSPMAAVEVTAQDTFLHLGTVIAPAGHGIPGKTAIKLKIDYPDETTEEHDLPYGIIQLIPLAADQTVQLEVRPTRSFDIVPGQIGQGASATVSGGALGLIIDTRGRPLRLPEDHSQRQEQLEEWLTQITNPTTE